MKKTDYLHKSGSDGLELECMRIEPEDTSKVRGILQLVHGMSEYKERYEPFMRYMAGKGYICVIHDNRGHGGSVKEPADLGYMYEGGYEALIEDIHEITLEVKEYAAGLCPEKALPYTLLGHSMGSLAVRCYLRKYDTEIDRLCVLGCPSELKGMKEGLALAKFLSLIKGDKSYSELMDNIVFASVNTKELKAEGLDNSWLNTDRKEVEKYNMDPLCGFRFTLNGYINLIKLSMLTYKTDGSTCSKPELPIRFFSGSDDPFAVSRKDIAKAMRVLKKAGYENVRGRMYPGMRHEILNEPKKGRVYRDILEFIEGDKD